MTPPSEAMPAGSVATDEERLYALLPAIYRVRDHAIGSPMRSLVDVMSREIAAVQEGIEQSYDDLFIETCAEWAVPYIGELIGARLLRLPPGSTLSQRAQVANTLALRRRKGTIAALEEVARDVTMWPVVAVEFFRLLATTQHARHPRPDNLVTVDLRNRRSLDRINTAFDRATHLFEARRAASGRGRYNIPNVGIFLFRLRALPLRNVTAGRVDDFRYTFDPLGIDQPLFTLPEAERSITDLAGPIHVPIPIDRGTMSDDVDAYYGRGRSLSIVVNGTPVDATSVVVCDLRDAPGGAWAHAPVQKYAVDPTLGRLALPTGQPAPVAGSVLVTYHHGAPDAIGGGGYDRVPPADSGPRLTLTDGVGLQAALAGTAGDATLVFTDSQTYALSVAGGTPALSLPAGASVVIAAADGERPLIDVSGGELLIEAGEGASLTLSGVVISGGAVRVRGGLTSLTIDHCTLVPGITRTRDSLPAVPDAPSLIIDSPAAIATLDACMLGGIRAVAGALVTVRRSVVDATAKTNVAYAASADPATAGGELTLEETTVVGVVRTARLSVSSCILVADAAAGAPPVVALQVQSGCARYSYLPLASRTPSRYRCQPTASSPEVRPLFTTLRFGVPGYAQLDPACPREIASGGEQDGEMGVFHSLYQSYREANLRLRLNEHLRFGLEAGVIYAS